MRPIFGQAAAKSLKVGLIGAGGRGSGAFGNMQAAAKIVGIELIPTAISDPQQNVAMGTAQKYNFPADKVFTGFDGYRKVLESGIDVVIIATPPNFRPLHFEHAAKVGVHVFAEKPVAVDAPGIRRFIAAGEELLKKNKSMIAGTQRRHERGYLQNAKAVQEGAIGQILGGTIHWCQNQLWFKKRNDGESNAMYLARNWVNFNEMSGDHIVEQHVHNIDVANWFIGRNPVLASGFGDRVRRVTGNQYDFFSVDFDYGDGVHIHSMCRQINGCFNRIAEHFRGTEGEVQGGGKLTSSKGAKAPEVAVESGDPYVQEHVALLRAILGEKPVSEATQVAHSTLTAIMGRVAAYTGQVVRWSDLLEKQDSPFYNLALAPTAEDFEKGEVICPEEETAPKAGK
jgi:predicted dehydrogenase